ncbi:hypothetical protein [Cellulomonas fengjieae]|uniref:Uncharacterized protein n=1 Tax=Cellulomonas fengjieae TaxID=2819978 RepID=A0ABS3SDF8_9CELL|nr:hypothetical protein [Cellulomonas fengjieae]MBO3083016.1 hypothetical protein [Cellulomonas fengjieae]QVI65613.1 hypothetical protein KG102_16190 [Cellulomonas fengjieae]
MTKRPKTDPLHLEIVRAREAQRVWVDAWSAPLGTSFDDVARRAGLEPLGDQWETLGRAAAVDLLALLLHRDLAYSGIAAPATQARELAEGFVGSFGPEECRYATNRPLRGGRFAPSWNPATSFTFDAGVIVVGRERAGVLWVADED